MAKKQTSIKTQPIPPVTTDQIDEVNHQIGDAPPLGLRETLESQLETPPAPSPAPLPASLLADDLATMIENAGNHDCTPGFVGALKAQVALYREARAQG